MSQSFKVLIIQGCVPFLLSLFLDIFLCIIVVDGWVKCSVNISLAKLFDSVVQVYVLTDFLSISISY